MVDRKAETTERAPVMAWGPDAGLRDGQAWPIAGALDRLYERNARLNRENADRKGWAPLPETQAETALRAKCNPKRLQRMNAATSPVDRRFVEENLAKELGCAWTDLLHLRLEDIDEANRRLWRERREALAAWPVPLEPVTDGGELARLLAAAGAVDFRFRTEEIPLEAGPIGDALHGWATRCRRALREQPVSLSVGLHDLLRDLAAQGVRVHAGRFVERCRVAVEGARGTGEMTDCRKCLILLLSAREREADCVVDRSAEPDDTAYFEDDPDDFGATMEGLLAWTGGRSW